MPDTVTKLKESYERTKKSADDFRQALSDQISQLLEQNSVRPAIRIEHRTKEWSSILTKLDRLAESWDDVTKIWDLVGLRLVFLFPEEAAQACALIDTNFNVVFRTPSNQKPNEFGYQSVHFTVRLRPEWLRVPTLRNHSNLQAEIQVRTIAQHNWAVASRILQYNNRSFAPPSVERSLFRVAALLELVDLELERVQKRRDAYRAEIDTGSFDQLLNIELLAAILNHYLPPANRLHNEDYSNLLFDLSRRGLAKGTEVIALIDKHLNQALTNDATVVREVRSGNSSYVSDSSRIDRGVFYSHVGLMQNMLNLEYGSDWRKTVGSVT